MYIRMYIHMYVRYIRMYIHTCYVLIKTAHTIYYVLAAVFASWFCVLISLLHIRMYVCMYVGNCMNQRAGELYEPASGRASGQEDAIQAQKMRYRRRRCDTGAGGAMLLTEGF